MSRSSDMEMVDEYARHNSQSAFAELVERHVNLVYSAALRHAGASAAEEITQAVFVILARKAAGLRADTILEAWLYETTRFTALSFLRTERRRQFREQEAYMDSVLQQSGTDSGWTRLSPLLDDAMMRLGRKEREAIVLRFFKGHSLREVAGALAISEAAAQKRVGRALEKLHLYFQRRGVSSTTAIIAGEMAVHSVQVAPVALAQAATAVALGKGAATSAMTPTLVKGALKIMAWTKMKTAVVAGVVVLVVAGTTTISLKEMADHRTYPWQLRPGGGVAVLNETPPQVRIVPALKNRPSQGEWTADDRIAGWGHTAKSLVLQAYSAQEARTVIAPDIVWPSGLFDFMANLPKKPREALQVEARKKFGVVGHRETRNQEVLLLKLRDPKADGVMPSKNGNGWTSSSSDGRFAMTGMSVDYFCYFLEGRFNVPVVNGTGLTARRYDLEIHWEPGVDNEGFKQALLSQLGLELVPANQPMEVTVLERATN